MRVLHIYSGNLYGGIESMLATLARSEPLVPGFKAEYALAFDGRLAAELRANGSRVHVLGEVRVSRPATILRARAALSSVLALGAFDAAIVHAPWSHALFASAVRDAGVPLVFWAHDVMTGRHWTERMARRVAPDLVICNSAFTRESLPLLFPTAGGAAVIHPAVAIATDEPTTAARQALRASFDTSADAVVVATACRAEAWKGHQLLIEALGEMGTGGTEWVWWQIGGAQRPAETQYLAGLRRLAAKRGIAARVRWLGDRSDVTRLLHCADVYCQPNQQPEPFGIAFVEALSAGLPVVTSDFGGAREIVASDCGVLVSPGERTRLASALRALIEDPQARRALGCHGPARARALCDPAAQLSRLVSVLAGLAQPVHEAARS